MAVILSDGRVLTSDWTPLNELLSDQKPREGTKVIPVNVLAQRLEELRAQWQEACAGNLQHVTLDLDSLFDDLAELCEVELPK